MCYLPVERVHESVKRKRRGNGRRELTGEVGAPGGRTRWLLLLVVALLYKYKSRFSKDCLESIMVRRKNVNSLLIANLANHNIQALLQYD